MTPKHDVNLPAAGSFGAPPPGAPQEVSSTNVAPTRDQIRQARQHDTVEPVFAPTPMTRAQMVALIGEEAVQRAERAEGVIAGDVAVAGGGKPAGTASTPQLPVPPAAAVVVTSSIKPPDIAMPSKRRRMGGPAASPPKIILTDASIGYVADAPEVPAPPALDLHGIPAGIEDAQETTRIGDYMGQSREPAVDAPPAHVVPPRRPAESDTDTPARGLPKAITDPGKKITGGFGDVGDAQYFPLDGRELKALVEGLMSEVHARLQDDLRFSIACVYPRVTARVVIEIQGFTVDQSFQIPKVQAHEKTPLALARERADEIVFCVVSERQEMTEDGESVTPPNQTRIDLGLPVPRKQAVETPGGRQLVDVQTQERS